MVVVTVKLDLHHSLKKLKYSRCDTLENTSEKIIENTLKNIYDLLDGCSSEHSTTFFFAPSLR